MNKVRSFERELHWIVLNSQLIYYSISPDKFLFPDLNFTFWGLIFLIIICDVSKLSLELSRKFLRCFTNWCYYIYLNSSYYHLVCVIFKIIYFRNLIIRSLVSHASLPHKVPCQRQSSINIFANKTSSTSSSFGVTEERSLIWKVVHICELCKVSARVSFSILNKNHSPKITSSKLELNKCTLLLFHL